MENKEHGSDDVCEGCGFGEREHPIKHILEDGFGNKQVIASCEKFKQKRK